VNRFGLGQNARNTGGAGILPAASPQRPVNRFGLGQNARTTGGAGILPAAIH
jgi:hypothetical protein